MKKWLPRKKRVNLEKYPVTPEVAEAREQLRQVRSRWPEINGLVGRLADMNDANHYSQLIIHAMHGGKQ